jgi:hypothetical protein
VTCSFSSPCLIRAQGPVGSKARTGSLYQVALYMIVSGSESAMRILFGL